MQKYADIYLPQNHSTHFGVTSPIIRSTKNCNSSFRYRDNIGTATSLQRGLIGTPDDGWCDTRNMKSDFAVNKYLHTVASSWILLALTSTCSYMYNMCLSFINSNELKICSLNR